VGLVAIGAYAAVHLHVNSQALRMELLVTDGAGNFGDWCLGFHRPESLAYLAAVAQPQCTHFLPEQGRCPILDEHGRTWSEHWDFTAMRAQHSIIVP
jgi:hypothetical protein